jgi:hypothetical protein
LRRPGFPYVTREIGPSGPAHREGNAGQHAIVAELEVGRTTQPAGKEERQPKAKGVAAAHFASLFAPSRVHMVLDANADWHVK